MADKEQASRLRWSDTEGSAQRAGERSKFIPHAQLVRAQRGLAHVGLEDKCKQGKQTKEARTR
jgi:hypothetical protein